MCNASFFAKATQDKTADSAKKLRASAVAPEALADQPSPRRGYGLAGTSTRRASLERDLDCLVAGYYILRTMML